MCEATLVEAVKLFILCYHHRTLRCECVYYQLISLPYYVIVQWLAAGPGMRSVQSGQLKGEQIAQATPLLHCDANGVEGDYGRESSAVNSHVLRS